MNRRMTSLSARLQLPLIFILATGNTIILEFGQGLWFGERMECSLINPNQVRHFGIPLCDDPTDPHRDIGITLEDSTFIPFKMRGTTCYFYSYELESCETYRVSDPQHIYDKKCTVHVQCTCTFENM